jgi:hypothetical protein
MDVLLGYASLEQMSVAQRMHWASRRRTTRIEDMAYCLMGIFGVNMPLLYGEGDQAFIRLQVEILRSTTDQSIFVWQCPSDNLLRYQLSGLLAPSPACFQESDDIRLPSAVLDTGEATSAPSTITNTGLHVRLKLTARENGEGDGPASYFVILDCAPRSGEPKGTLKRRSFHALPWRPWEAMSSPVSTRTSSSSRRRVEPVSGERPSTSTST